MIPSPNLTLERFWSPVAIGVDSGAPVRMVPNEKRQGLHLMAGSGLLPTTGR
jgi:hypothetical protein